MTPESRFVFQLQNPWWSPAPPEAYTYREDGPLLGLGTLWRVNPGLYNLLWVTAPFNQPPEDLYVYRVCQERWIHEATISALLKYKGEDMQQLAEHVSMAYMLKILTSLEPASAMKSPPVSAYLERLKANLNYKVQLCANR